MFTFIIVHARKSTSTALHIIFKKRNIYIYGLIYISNVMYAVQCRIKAHKLMMLYLIARSKGENRTSIKKRKIKGGEKEKVDPGRLEELAQNSS